MIDFEDWVTFMVRCCVGVLLCGWGGHPGLCAIESGDRPGSSVITGIVDWSVHIWVKAFGLYTIAMYNIS